mmetsp:Transcript_30621/g.40460  ORF Transcript_30621/g.40460 Transcript_30621/m.40460 type:complete len:503 (+) Transcript_30621:33-1541(+)
MMKNTIVLLSLLLSLLKVQVHFSFIIEYCSFSPKKSHCSLERATFYGRCHTSAYSWELKGKESSDDEAPNIETSPLQQLRKAQQEIGGMVGSVTYPEYSQGPGKHVTVDNVLVKFEGAGLSASSTVPWFFDQCHWGLLEFKGEDRLKFLHGQCTNAIETARPGMVVDAAITSNLGRVVDLCRIAILPDRCLLICSPNRKKILMETFDKYIFPADKVTMKEVKGLGMFTLAGNGNTTAKVLETMGVKKLPVSGTHIPWAQANGKKALLLSGVGLGPEYEGYTTLVPWSSALSLWGTMAWWAAYGGEEEWQHLRVQQGRPFPGKELTKDYNALESGLFHTIHFNKGCYIGQETIAKVNNAKKLKTQLYGITFSSGSLVEENTKIESKDGVRAGVITSTIEKEDGSTFGLAYIRAQAGASPGSQVKIPDSTIVGEITDISYPTRSDEQAAEPPKRNEASEVKKDESESQAEKDAEAARKAKKLEEMQKRLAAFQAKKKKPPSSTS